MAQFNFIGKKIEILKGEGWNGNIEFIAPPINLYEGHYSYLFGTGAIQEYRIKINDKVYGNEAFKDAINLQENLLDKSTFTVGSFTISVLKLKLKVPSEEIPHNASVVFSYRYNDGEIQSEWVERFKGKVTKRTKYTDEVTTIEAKDKASNYDVFLDYFGDSISKYPANTRVVAKLCAEHLGLEIENIEDVVDLDIVEYPNELTMVEMLKNVARNSGGNWVIIGEKLRLVTTGTYKNEVDYPARSVETSSLLSPISKILMYYADESAFESGNDTGSTIEIDSKWATQDSADYVHSVLNGFEYVPVKSLGTYIDPAIELGDIVSIDGNDVLVANVKWVFDGIVTADIEVPINNEENYDDPYNTLVQNQFKRKVSLGDSYQGVTISRDKGIEMLVSPDGTEENATGRYFADIYRGIAFQSRDNKDQDWHDWMYFDINEKTFKMNIIEEIQKDIDEMEKITIENSAGIEGLSDQVKIHADRITTTEKDIIDIDGKVTQTQKDVKEQSGRLDVAYDKIESNVSETNKVKNRVTGVEQTVSKHDTQISQTAKDINIQAGRIDNIHVGSRNWLLKSDISTNAGDKWSEYGGTWSDIQDREVTISIGITVRGAKPGTLQNRAGVELVIEFTDGSKRYVSAWYTPEKYGTTYKGRVSATHKLSDIGTSGVVSIKAAGMHAQIEANYLNLYQPQLEIGNTASDWKLSDLELAESDKVISYINVSPERIKIKSNKLELEGYTTINKNFWVDNNGNMGAAGGTIAGWKLSTTELWGGVAGSYVGLISDPAHKGAFYAGGKTGWKDSKFSVYSDGRMYATSGEIGGWTLEPNSLWGGNAGNYVGLISDTSQAGAFYAGGATGWIDSKFSVYKDGRMFSTSGEIGGWTINDDTLYSGSGSSQIALNSNQSKEYAIRAGGDTNDSANFLVTKSGYMRASSGRIGGWVIGASHLSMGGAWNKPNQFMLTTSDKYNYLWVTDNNGSIKFSVSRAGVVNATGATISGNITASSGSIGNYSISSGSLVGNNVRLNTNSIVINGVSMYAATSNVIRVGGGMNFDSAVQVAKTLFANGGLQTYGTKNAIVPTRDGLRAIHAYETATAHFGDIGEVYVDNVSIIHIDEIFGDTIHLEDYHVFVSPYGNARVWVENRTPESFEIHTDSPCQVSWEVKGVRRGYRDKRLEVIDKTFQDYGKEVGDIEEGVTDRRLMVI